MNRCDLVFVDGCWSINLDRVSANVHLHGATPNDLKLHFVPTIRGWFPEGNVPMFIQPLISRRFSTALAVTSLLFPVTPLIGQTPVATPSRVQTEIVQFRGQNAAIRNELRKLEERQRMLLLLVQALQGVCDVSSAPVADGAASHANAAPSL